MQRAAGLQLGAVLLLVTGPSLWAQQAGQVLRGESSGQALEILADSQQRLGDTYMLRGHVEIRYRGLTLRADEITYNETSGEALAQGQVELEHEQETVRAEAGRYNLRTGEGEFTRVRATLGGDPSGLPLGTSPQPNPDPDLLVSPNPFYFEAERVERRADGTYLAHRGWVTNCTPESAKWKLKAHRVEVRPQEHVRLYRSSFLLARVPIFYSPFFTYSLRPRRRQSGFLQPTMGNNSRKGARIGEAFFWAINDHADLLLGAELFQRRGWSRHAELRVLPTARSSIVLTYFGVSDRGAARRAGPRIDQSGEFAHLSTEGELGGGFRGVVDFTYLSSLRFRLGFSETFNEAVASEVLANAFLSNNPDTYYFNAYFRRYRNFEVRQLLDPLAPFEETAVTLASAPAAEFGTRPRHLGGQALPLYVSLETSAAQLRRGDRRLATLERLERFDLYPRVTLPLLRSPYLRLTPTFGFRLTQYGGRLTQAATVPGCPADGRTGLRVLDCPLRRVTAEASLDLRLPAFTRIFERPQHRTKHVLEPQVVYRYVDGVERFDEILRFDETDILTDTREVEYSITNRVLRKHRGTPPEGAGSVEEFFSWRLAQKYFFDPDLGGVLRTAERNVVAALTSLTGFAWASGPRRFSPLVSTFKITPGRQYDTEWRLDYDLAQHQLVNSRLTVSALLWREFRASLAHFVTRNDPLLQPRSHQLRFLASWGQMNRRGLNVAFGASWNIQKDVFQNSTAQATYNWDCCGVAFEFRRLGLGQLRSENQYRFAFSIANLGTFGTLRRQERLF